MGKGAFIGVNDVARKIKKGYVGVVTEIPVYEEGVNTVSITADNISEYFTVNNGSYYFKGSGSVFTTTNGGVDSSTASTVLTAKQDISSLTFNYSYSSEASYDKFTLKVGGATVEDAVSGSTTSKSYSGSLSSGQTIEFSYVKDSSQSKNDDKCTFSAMVITVVKQVQTGVELRSIARQIKKAYIGVGGVARPCWSGGELAYWGSLTNLGAGYNLAATTVGDHALFGGGYTSVDGMLSTVNAYDESLIKSTPTDLSLKRRLLAATSVGNFAVFAGGEYAVYDDAGDADYFCADTVDAYDSSLTRCTPTFLSRARNSIATTTVGNFALFGGGYGDDLPYYATTVDAYDASLTKTTPTKLNAGRSHACATTTGDYALFASGTTYVNTATDEVEVYDSSLTKLTSITLSAKRYAAAATTVGSYALIGGGYNGNYNNVENYYSSLVDAYDKSLTRITPSELSLARCNTGAATIGDFALFAGGKAYTTGSQYGSSVVDAYDTSLTRSVQPPLVRKTYLLSGTSVGNKVLFGGGYLFEGKLDVYAVS